MRALLFAVFAAAGLAGTALAEPADPVARVEVTLSPELQQKAVEEYGLKDVQRLAEDLRKDAARQIERTGVLAGGRLELTLVDVKPNRPTFKQLGDKPGLSMESFGVGGAAIEGRAISMDGVVTPVRYKWYETDIRQARFSSTWSDAQHAIDRFAAQLGHGNLYARR
jgi:hypothetical protein